MSVTSTPNGTNCPVARMRPRVVSSAPNSASPANDSCLWCQATAKVYEGAAVQADIGDAVHHQHRRGGQLGIARAEIATLARLQQIVL